MLTGQTTRAGHKRSIELHCTAELAVTGALFLATGLLSEITPTSASARDSSPSTVGMFSWICSPWYAPPANNESPYSALKCSFAVPTERTRRQKPLVQIAAIGAPQPQLQPQLQPHVTADSYQP